MYFKVDMFQNDVTHILDLELSPDDITRFQKDTNTSTYINFTNFVCFVNFILCRLEALLHMHPIFAQEIN